MRNREILLLFLSGIPLLLLGQESDRGNLTHQAYQEAISVYNHRQYQGAQSLFERTTPQADYVNRANSQYYAANAAVRLNQVGADKLMTRFVEQYPLSVRRNSAYLDVADYYFDSGKYPNAVTWYRKADLTGLFGKNRERFYFRMGYGLFATDKPDEAKRYLQRVSNSREYGSQAKYYLGFSAYQQDDYQQASRQFDQITDQQLLQEKLTYFQADMNFKLGNFGEAITQAKKQLPKSDAQETSELNKIIGESYFNLKQYDLAIPYLEAYKGKSGRWSNTDFYLLGYAHYQQGNFEQAIGQFNKIINGNDFVAQNAYYHLGVCYLESDKKQEALNAFRNAASMDYNGDIQKDALYNYALLSYEIGNPYEPVQEVLALCLNQYPNESRNEEIRTLLVDSYITSRNFEAALDLAQANRSSIDTETYQKVLYFRGVELYLADNYKAAEPLFQSASTLNGNPRITALAVYWKAESDYAMRLYQQALAGYAQFKNLPQARTTSVYKDLSYQMGYVYFNLKRYGEAVLSFQNYCSEVPEGPNFSDACLRLGDSYFAGSQYREAIVAYERAKGDRQAQTDFADFQIALSLGFLGQDAKKTEILKSFVSNYPNSALADDALLELGNTYLDQGQEELALQTYNRLRSQYPNSTKTVIAEIRKGLIYYNRGDNQTALRIFQDIAEQYPSNPESVQAVESAKRVAVELGQVAEFAAWVAGLNFIEVSAGELESAAFEAAERQLVAGNTKAARKNYESYLQQFPSGTNHLAVRFELARICYVAGESQKALDYFKPVAASSSGDMAEQALTRICEILVMQNDYIEAIPYLQQLENTANIAQNRIFAQSNLMKGYYQQHDYNRGLQYAQTVLLSPSLDQRIRSDAHLVMARTAWETGDTLRAQSAYASLLSESFGEASAEALYFDAFFKQRANPEASNAAVQRLLQEFGSYREWGGKGLLLMAQNFSVLDDAFQATYILENIISNFQDYPDLVNQAQSELNALKLKEARRNADVNPEGN